MKTGIELIEEERRRQVEVEGWDTEHDDQYQRGVLGRAGTCYETANEETPIPPNWPWDAKYWKPKDKLSNLVRAGALYLAEVDKADRGECSDDNKMSAFYWRSRAIQAAEQIDMMNEMCGSDCCPDDGRCEHCLNPVSAQD